MKRYSDRAIEIINELCQGRLDYQSEYLPLINAAIELPAYEDTGLEPEQVMQKSLQPHGKWVDSSFYNDRPLRSAPLCYDCSNCGHKLMYKPNYCPNCSAKMN